MTDSWGDLFWLAVLGYFAWSKSSKDAKRIKALESEVRTLEERLASSYAWNDRAHAELIELRPARPRDYG